MVSIGGERRARSAGREHVGGRTLGSRVEAQFTRTVRHRPARFFLV